MKKNLLIFFFILSTNILYAQTIDYGYSVSFAINDISPNRKVLINYNDAYKNMMINRSKSLNIGGIVRYKKVQFGLNLDLYRYDNDLLQRKGLTINDIYNGKNLLILENETENMENENNFAISYTADYGFNGTIGLEVYRKNNFNINFTTAFGINSIKGRTSKALVQEEGSNVFYNATYVFKTEPIFSYSPRFEFEYTSDKNLENIFFYFFTGVHFQNSTFNTYRSLASSNGNFSTEESTSYPVKSSTMMAGIGVRVLEW